MHYLSDDPQWKVPPSYAGRLASSEERNGVRILRSYAYIPNSPTSLKRVLHEGSFVASSLLGAIARRRPDLLLAVSPPLGQSVNAILLSRLWRIPYVFDVQDLQPDSAAELNMLPSWALSLLYKVERAAYRHATLVTTLTNGMRKRIIDKGVPAEKVKLIEPRADDSLFEVGRLAETHLETHFENGMVSKTSSWLLTAAIWVSSSAWM